MEGSISSKIIDKLKEKKMALAPLGIFVVLLLVGQVAAPGFAAPGNILHLLVIAVPYGIMGIGETLVILSGTEDLDFSIGAHASLAIVLGASFLNYFSLPVVFLLVMLVGLVFGVVNGVGVRVAKVPPLIMTFGTAGMMYGTAIAYSGGATTGEATALLEKLAVGRIGGFPISIIIWILLTILAMYLLHKTIYGRALYASGSNPEAAYIGGVSNTKIGIVTYALSGAFAALAGMLILGRVGAPYDYRLAATYTLPVIAGVVLGGTNFFGGEGGYIGTIGGVLALTTLVSFLTTLQVSQAGRIFMNGVILAVILLFYARGSELRQ